MNVLTVEKRAQIVHCLVEGCSLRATARMTGVARQTVTDFLVAIGPVCSQLHDTRVRDLTSKRVQCDEIWSFVKAKDKNVYEDEACFGRGSVWTWTAIDAETKLCISYLVGMRDAGYAWAFMQDVRSRLSHRVQLTTDGHRSYLSAVEEAFGADVDYAMLIKLYGNDPAPTETRYSPAECTGTVVKIVEGEPDEKHISTSYVERANLTMRMGMRRFTRLTNAFSKKVENHAHAVALHFAHYNFCRVHQTLRVTPAMEAGITDHVWSIEDLCQLVPEPERAAWGTKNGRRSASNQTQITV